MKYKKLFFGRVDTFRLRLRFSHSVLEEVTLVSVDIINYCLWHLLNLTAWSKYSVTLEKTNCQNMAPVRVWGLVKARSRDITQLTLSKGTFLRKVHSG